MWLWVVVAAAGACSPPVQHFTGQPPAPLSTTMKNVLLIGDSISMGGDPVSDPVTLAGNPGGYGSYVLEQLTGHNIVSVQHNGGAYNGSVAHAGDEQAGTSDHGLDCLDYWIGLNSTHPNGLPWDAIHFNFGLHDLETSGPNGPFATSPDNYTRNLEAIWQKLARTGAAVIFATTTPVLMQRTDPDCKYCRNESSVKLYNALAVEAITNAAATTSPGTPLRINDIFGDVEGFCGADYARCTLQLSHGVHFTREGREYTGLSVSTSILSALYNFGKNHTQGDHIAAAAGVTSHPTGGVAAVDLEPLRPVLRPRPVAGPPPCGEPATALNPDAPNVLLIGDSISMGYGFYNGTKVPTCKPGSSCEPDNRLGYGLYVREMLRNATANWTLADVQHCGGWYLGGQAGNTGHGTGCIDAWLGKGITWDVIHVNFGLHDLNNFGKEVPIGNYQTNLAIIFTKLKATGSKLIFQTSTPVPVGDGGGKRTEANVELYNEAALVTLGPDIKSGRIAVHDLHGDIVARCGPSYTATGKCELQIPNNVHFEYEGRQFCAISVVRSILKALYGFGATSTL